MKRIMLVFLMLLCGGFLFAESVDFLLENSIYVFPWDGREAYIPEDLTEQGVPQVDLIEMDNESRRATLYYNIGNDTYYIEPVDILLWDGEEADFSIADESSLHAFVFDSRVLGEFILYFDDDNTMLFEGYTMAPFSSIIEMKDWSLIAHGMWTTSEMQEEDILAEEIQSSINQLKDEYKDFVFQ
jgi:hypothetical protein